jgi:hypothetical protein
MVAMKYVDLRTDQRDWRSRRRTVAAGMMAGLLGCNQGPTLDEAIRGWLEVWSEASREKCVCYHLYVDLREPEHGPYASKEDCLASVIEPTDAAVDCIEAVLESGPYKTKENVEIMECYQAVEQEERTCFAENFSDDCSGPPRL